ncbi:MULTISPECIES: 30S ribosomal protein S9 [Prosthecochloris]|uniref:Small ribosomal subunit protein uS9 n=1 Tax=Prosthecochloris marina TaxID=2017681 RepID=A0A317T874_9CHLB|nr:MULTISPECIES: 30S ribosomal protein S9 [Prosthecochloris]PWW82949.1 30S ribosomal protein S9 [Prosthecochloris marina]UZJ38860.1 30S ribosomal protein S9 [Prosthecochloris sp. SCSIO W1103]
MKEVINAVGRRKTSVARVFLVPGKGSVTVNKRPADEYFRDEYKRSEALKPLMLSGKQDEFDVKVNVQGGGISGQAGAVSLAIARALVEADAENRLLFRKDRLMTRDPRMVERKKYGQKKARKRFQFSKR